CVVAVGRGPTSPNDGFLWLWVLACARTTEERDRLTSLRGLAAHGVRVVPIDVPSSWTEGAGKTGCPSHPWSACRKKARGRTTGTNRNNRPSLRNGVTAYTCSPR